jgi:pyruvate formate lyase activating enzyme
MGPGATASTGKDGFTGKPAGYWHALEDGRLQCDLCPRFCRLRDGQRGLCYVRGRRGDGMVLTTYGRSSGFCIDPIEKKPLYHFLPGTPVLSFGTAGCNLACKFCQNWDISKARSDDRLQVNASPQAIADAAVRTACDSVAFTYNDPVIFLEYAVATAEECHARGIHTVAVSAGTICAAPREDFFRHVDAVNIDLKSFSEGFYRTFCGGTLAPVLETLEYIAHETSAWLEITTLVIPGENDSDDEIDRMTQWIAERLGTDVPLHFSAFHPAWKLTDRPATSRTSLRRAREIALGNGLRYTYTGNVIDLEGSATYCPGCSETVVERAGYDLGCWNLAVEGGRASCKRCGAKVAGVYAGRPGGWGSRFQPVGVGR